jgi:hypothetical protein
VFSGVVAQGLAKRRRFDPCLELSDPLALSLRLTVHGILKPLEELLQVRQPGLKRSNLGELRIDAGGRRGPIWSRG